MMLLPELRLVWDGVFLCAVSHIEIVGEVGVFRSHSVDAAYLRQHVEALAVRAHAQHVGLHGALGIFHDARNLEVGESQKLGLLHGVAVDILNLIESLELSGECDDIVELIDKPDVNLGEVGNLLGV